VTPADEAYWDQYKASPKIFFNLATAQRLMGSTGELTSVRVPAAQAADFQRSVLNALTPDATGFASRSFAADQPANTDFAGLFLGLSGFLLIAAILLVVLLFRLAVEQRTRQMGLLGALGFTPARIARMILAEGSLVALLGMLAGLPLAVMYTRLLVSGLGTLWIGATGTRAIGLHIHGLTLLIGGATSLVAAVSALALTAWRVARSTPIAQLHGLGCWPIEPRTTQAACCNRDRWNGGCGCAGGGLLGGIPRSADRFSKLRISDAVAGDHRPGDAAGSLAPGPCDAAGHCGGQHPAPAHPRDSVRST